MTYFSRLTDIVTCNLTAMLRASPDPAGTLAEIILEMEEGLAGARRSVATAAANAEKLRSEIDTLRGQVTAWREAARTALADGRESDARAAVSRKQEVEDVAAGLEQEYAAAVATRDHLETMLRALQGRLADARRKRLELAGGSDENEGEIPDGVTPDRKARTRAVEDELDALKREMGK